VSEPIGPKTAALIRELDETAQLLRRYGERQWAAWLERDAHLLGESDGEGIRHLLSAFGGMGSLNDVILAPSDGNAELQERLGRLYQLAEEIRKEAGLR
jgi:hypothetical protein